MNKIKNIIAVSAFSLMVMALPAVVSAQWGGYPNGGVYNGGRSRTNLENVADRLKDRSRDLERQIDREFNYNRNRNTSILGTILGGGTYGNRGYGNDRIKRLAEDFRHAADRFEGRVDNDDRRRDRRDDDYNDRYNDRNWNGNGRDRQAAERLLNIGSQLDNELRRMRVSSSLQYRWNAIRSDLNLVARAYGRGGNYNNRFPF
jgi:hypothetical protein